MITKLDELLKLRSTRKKLWGGLWWPVQQRGQYSGTSNQKIVNISCVFHLFHPRVTQIHALTQLLQAKEALGLAFFMGHLESFNAADRRYSTGQTYGRAQFGGPTRSKSTTSTNVLTKFVRIVNDDNGRLLALVFSSRRAIPHHTTKTLREQTPKPKL